MDPRQWRHDQPIEFKTGFDWLILEPILLKLRHTLADSPFRGRSACELATDHAPVLRSIDDNVIANTWQLIKGIAAADRVDMGKIYLLG